MADTDITFDPTTLEEAIGTVQAIAQAIQVFGESRHDNFPQPALSWLGTHLVEVGDTLRTQFRAWHRESHGA